MLSILGIVAIVIITIQVYKTAVGTERNAAGWAAITVVIGIALQFVVPVIIGLLIGVYLVVTGTPAEELQNGLFGLMSVIGVAAIILSIVGMFLVARHVSKVKDDTTHGQAPPPPPVFGNNQ
ncbi:MAG: hypothetical protein ABI857_10665 [Acidobacteriota bacterium]